jgi:hypothetical protein
VRSSKEFLTFSEQEFTNEYKTMKNQYYESQRKKQPTLFENLANFNENTSNQGGGGSQVSGNQLNEEVFRFERRAKKKA